MRNKFFLLLTALLAIFVFTPNTLAQDYKQWGLPTGAKARLGKGRIWGIQYSPDGTLLMVASAIGIWIYDAQTGEEQSLLTRHTDRIIRVAFSPDGSRLASGSSDGTVRLWNPVTGAHRQTLTGHRDGVSSVAFSPDGSILASGSWDGTVCLWNPVTGEHRQTLTGHLGGGGVNSVAFSPDGSILASGGGSFDRTVRLWDAVTGAHRQTHTGHWDRVLSLAFSPDGRTLAIGSFDSTVHLWDAVTGAHRQTHTGHWDGAWSLAFSPDGRTLASGGRDDNRVHLWDVVTGAHRQTLTGHTDEVKSVAFSPDSSILASAGGSFDGTVRLWDAVTGEHRRTLTGHMQAVNSVAFSPDGSTLASGSSDGSILLWVLAPTPPEPETEKIVKDINIDGIVNIPDLVSVASNLGQMGENVADVNNDKIVNIVDLTLVAADIEEDTEVTSTWSRYLEFTPTREQVEQWLRQARQVNLTDATFQRGILILEQLLTSLTPKETALLQNYPNPFNPETWIPYQLATPVAARISIYTVDGKLVRTLDLGHQSVGIYASQKRAAYWDGRNDLGEPVTNGVYFYTLSTGDFTAIRKMLVRK